MPIFKNTYFLNIFIFNVFISLITISKFAFIFTKALKPIFSLFTRIFIVNFKNTYFLSIFIFTYVFIYKIQAYFFILLVI